ncbi:HNH endonuclease [Isosphaeraceae bacterium EP7]
MEKIAIEYAVITENDESRWDDHAGSLYHFPSRYAKYLKPQTKVVYYKGKQKNPAYANKRLSNEPHYFAVAEIGQSWSDTRSKKGDLFALVTDYRPFATGILAKQDGRFIETIPETRISSYWRDGVRLIEEATYQRIRGLATLLPGTPRLEDVNDENQGIAAGFESAEEGQAKRRFVTQYERDGRLRRAAVALHGTTCSVCGFDFENTYGAVGFGYTHIHHIVPISVMDGPAMINPATDMASVCANCHAMIHRRHDKTLCIEELRAIVVNRRCR